MTLKLYHCKGARSVRPLWTMEEMGLEYELEVMAFPPRMMRERYLDINPLGTVPAFTDDTDGKSILMTESAGISMYLADVYGPTDLCVTPDEPEYGHYLNWITRSDATLTFPQTIVLRYTQQEPEERKLPQAVADYTQWFFSRLRSVEAATADREFLVADRFTIADICVAYALQLATSLGFREGFKPNTEAYFARMEQRPAFIRANEL